MNTDGNTGRIVKSEVKEDVKRTDVVKRDVDNLHCGQNRLCRRRSQRKGEGRKKIE